MGGGKAKVNKGGKIGKSLYLEWYMHAYVCIMQGGKVIAYMQIK